MNNFNNTVYILFLSHFQTLQAQTQALELNSGSSGGNLNFSSKLKNLQTWIFWNRMRDLYIAFTSTGEERHNQNNSLVLIGAVLQVTVVLRQAPETGKAGNNGKALKWMLPYSNNGQQQLLSLCYKRY